MSNQQKKNSRYAVVGSLLFQTAFNEEGNRLDGEFKIDEDGKKLYVIRLDKKTEVIINGKNMSGKTLYVARPKAKYQRLLEKGIIDETEYNKKLEEHGPGGRLEFVQMEITADLEK